MHLVLPAACLAALLAKPAMHLPSRLHGLHINPRSGRRCIVVQAPQQAVHKHRNSCSQSVKAADVPVGQQPTLAIEPQPNMVAVQNGEIRIVSGLHLAHIGALPSETLCGRHQGISCARSNACLRMAPLLLPCQSKLLLHLIAFLLAGPRPTL